MMLVLKIPIVYLCAVVWWAVKAEPRPLEGAAVAAPIEPGPDLSPAHHCAPRRHRPRPGPGRRPARSRRLALARAELRR
jgi:hypothetical protein